MTFISILITAPVLISGADTVLGGLPVIITVFPHLVPDIQDEFYHEAVKNGNHPERTHYKSLVLCMIWGSHNPQGVPVLYGLWVFYLRCGCYLI